MTMRMRMRRKKENFFQDNVIFAGAKSPTTNGAHANKILKIIQIYLQILGLFVNS